MHVEFANSDDLPQLIAFAFNTYKEVELTNAKPDLASIGQTLFEAVLDQVPLVIRNPDNPALIDACLVMHVTSPWWSTEPMLQQLFFYTKPGVRKGAAINALLDAAKEYATINQLVLVQDLVGKDFTRKTKLLERKGFKLIGASLIYE